MVSSRERLGGTREGRGRRECVRRENEQRSNAIVHRLQLILASPHHRESSSCRAVREGCIGENKARSQGSEGTNEVAEREEKSRRSRSPSSLSLLGKLPSSPKSLRQRKPRYEGPCDSISIGRRKKGTDLSPEDRKP